MTLTGSEDVSIVIGLESCSAFPNGCSPVDMTEIMGTLLYVGPYNPQLDESQPWKEPYQNFSVLVPSTFTLGPASLNVAHFVLVGVSK